MEIYYGEDRAILESVCFFQERIAGLVPCHAYIAKGEDLADEPIPDIPCVLHHLPDLKSVGSMEGRILLSVFPKEKRILWIL